MTQPVVRCSWCEKPATHNLTGAEQRDGNQCCDVHFALHFAPVAGGQCQGDRHCCACLHFACNGDHESTGCEFCDATVRLWPVVLGDKDFVMVATSDYFPLAAPEVIGFALDD